MVDVNVSDPDMATKPTGTVQERQTGVGSTAAKAKFVKTNIRAAGVRLNFNTGVGSNGVEADVFTQLLAERMGLPSFIVRDTVFRAEITHHVSAIQGGRPLAVVEAGDLLSGGPPQLTNYINIGLPRTASTVQSAWRRMVRAQEIMFTNTDSIFVALRNISGEQDGVLQSASDSGVDTIIDTWTRTVATWRQRYNVSMESGGGGLPNLQMVWQSEVLKALANAAVAGHVAATGAGGAGRMVAGALAPAPAVHGGFALATTSTRVVGVTPGAGPKFGARPAHATTTEGQVKDSKNSKACRSFVQTGTCTWTGPTACKFNHDSQ
jgi:hypothetical protein